MKVISGMPIPDMNCAQHASPWFGDRLFAQSTTRPEQKPQMVQPVSNAARMAAACERGRR